jgi:hypothetical protein
MKTKTLFKVALMLILLAGGVDQAWADGTISIPQEMGSYILIGNASTNPKTWATGVTLSNCQVDGLQTHIAFNANAHRVQRKRHFE